MTLSQDEQRKLEAIEEALPHRPKADPLLRRNEQRGLGDSSPQVPDPPRRTAALTGTGSANPQALRIEKTRHQGGDPNPSAKPQARLLRYHPPVRPRLPAGLTSVT